MNEEQSSGDSAEQVQEMMDTANATESPVVEQETETPEPAQEEQLGEYGSQFLSDLEDDDLKERLTPYIRKWDAGVTRKFQDIHSQYRPYKELGEIEQIQKAQQLYQVINSNPQSALERLAQALGYNVNKAGQSVVDPDDEDEVLQAKLAEKLAPFQHKVEQQQQLLAAIAQNLQQQKQQEQYQQETSEFNKYLDLLEREKGSFDRQYVTALISQGVDPAKAVEQFQQIVQEQVNTNSRRQPPTLSGSGHVPSPNKDVTSLSKGEVNELVKSMLNPQ